MTDRIVLSIFSAGLILAVCGVFQLIKARQERLDEKERKKRDADIGY